uniref:PDZ domain-containing protein n=1 Tax=Denticeps clupeoides TaxID=299321 RepID=A0AAY4ALX4_9TELE
MENQSSKDEGTYSRLQTQDDSGLGRSELRLCFTDTKAVGSELKELTRSQNLVEQVRTQNSTQDLVGAKCNSTPTTSSGSAQNLSESKSAINSTFGPASLSPLSHWRSQESDGVSSVLNDTESSVAHWSKDRPAMRDTLFQPPLRKASENTQGKEYGAHRDLCTMSLGRAKSKNFVLTSNATSRCIKQNVKGNFTAGYDCKSQKTSAGTHSDSHGDEDVFDSQPLRATKRQDKKLLHSPSLDSVQSTIHKFEALAQQLKPVQQQRSRRALSVPANSNSEGGKRSRTDVTLAVRGDWDNGGMRKTSIERGIFMRSSSVDEAGLRKNACERSDSITQLPQHKPQNEPHTFRVRTKEDIHTDEPDFSISRARTKPINKEWINGSMRYSSLPQQPNSSDKSTTTEEDGDKTPTNSPFTLPLVSPLQAHLQSLTPIRAQNPQEDTILLPKKITDHNKSTVNSPPSSQPDLSTPVPVTCSSPNDCPPLNRLVLLDKTVDSGPLSTSVARWSSEEEDSEDYDDDDEDSDCESTVTITSQVSKSDRRSFSLSLADLCNAGGLDYCLPDDTGSNPGEYGSHRSASMSSDISGLSCVTLLGTEELENLLQDVCSLGDDTLQNYDEVKVVVLHKDVGSGLGFTMAGGVDQNKPITVHKVFPHGAAAQEGSICEGDQVLSINGTALQDAGHSEAIHTLRKARGQGTAVVVLKRDKATEQHRKRNGTKGHTGQRIKLVLQKRTFDLGFSLEGGVASSLGDKPLTVQKLFQGGPVGQVLPGDEILEVQGKSLTGLRRLEAWQLIKKLPPGPVEVILHRPPLQLH